jgi:hypothetical protein
VALQKRGIFFLALIALEKLYDLALHNNLYSHKYMPAIFSVLKLNPPEMTLLPQFTFIVHRRKGTGLVLFSGNILIIRFAFICIFLTYSISYFCIAVTKTPKRKT